MAELKKKIAESKTIVQNPEKQTSLALAENKNTIQSIFEHSTDGILLINEEGIVIGWNKRLEKITKIEKKEVIGQSCNDIQNLLLPDNVKSLDTIDVITSTINQYKKNGRVEWQTRNWESKIKNPHNEIVYIQHYLHPFITPKGLSFVVIIRDITEHKLAEISLIKREEQFRTVLQNMPVMMCANDSNGIFLVWNKECERVTGYTSYEIVGKENIATILYPSMKHINDRSGQKSKKIHDYRDWEIQLSTKDGKN